MGNIIWLASYPKSGNTWFRIFLEKLLNMDKKQDELFHLNTVQGASLRSLIDFHAGIETSDLTPDEIDVLRPNVYDAISDSVDAPYFLKTHETYATNQDSKPIYSSQATAGVICFVRNPLDIVGSYAHHFNISIEKSLYQMGNEGLSYYSETDELWPQVPYQLSSWSRNVESWLNASELKVKIVKYERMVHNTLDVFKEMVQFAGLDFSENEIEIALEACKFENLQKLEEKQPFLEKYPKTKNFFRKGKTGNWSNELTKEQINQIITVHGKTMVRCGYLTNEGDIVDAKSIA